MSLAYTASSLVNEEDANKLLTLAQHKQSTLDDVLMNLIINSHEPTSQNLIRSTGHNKTQPGNYLGLLLRPII